jgi:thioredoxin-like negative regulator of GroEL
MNRIIAIIFSLVLLASAGQASAGSIAAPLSTPELKQVIGSKKQSTIVFFQNPQGGPCRAQKGILEKLHKERKGNFNIANVSTMNPADERAFYEYGIRGLPSLILVDKNGNISRVFPPGIQTAEALSAALDGIK